MILLVKTKFHYLCVVCMMDHGMVLKNNIFKMLLTRMNTNLENKNIMSTLNFYIKILFT